MTKHITTDSRPHFIPGIYAWLVENFSRVYVSVLVDHPKFVGPKGLPLTEQILPVANPEDYSTALACKFKVVTLNLGTEAIGGFQMHEDGFEVTMRFNMVATQVFIPFEAIHSIYPPDNPAISPFCFILRPGQEEYSIKTDKERPAVVPTEPAVNDATAPKKAVVGRSERPSHLRLVK